MIQHSQGIGKASLTSDIVTQFSRSSAHGWILNCLADGISQPGGGQFGPRDSFWPGA
jgi:hypothetical protein